MNILGENVDMAEFNEIEERQKQYLQQWEEERIVRKCSCGKAYSYDQSELDPGECPSCGGREGELIY